MKHVMTLNEKPLKESMKNGGCGVPDLLPVRVQDFLHGRKSELRERKQIIQTMDVMHHR